MLAEPSVMNGPTRSLAAPHDTDVPKEVAVLSGTVLRTWFSEQTWSNSPPTPEAREALVNEKQRLLSHVDKTLLRRIWLVQGCLNLDELEAILKGVSACSRVILLVLDPEAVWSGPSDVNKRQAIANDERLFVITHGTPIDQAKAVNTLVDVRLYIEWKPVLGKSIAVSGISHLQDFYQAFTPLLNLKAVDKATRLHASHLFLSNALVNAVFAEQINTLGDYKDLYKNKPVLIVATGPSLNKQLDTLRKYKDHFIVIAVDPAVPILKKYGIVPQYVVSIDPKKRPYWQHNELDPSTTFLIELGCCPDVAWSSNHNYLVTSCHQDVHRLMNALGVQVPLMKNGGSVATSAFNFAHFTGANPIVMIGQDLAWTGGKDHAEGYVSQYSKDILNARYERGFEVEGYDGNPVRTEKQLLGYKTWFEERIKNMPETMVINSTEGGAKIHGTAQIAFEIVCKEIGKSKLGQFSINPSKKWVLNKLYLENYLKEIRNILNKINEMEIDLKKGVAMIEKINKTPKKSVIRQIMKINSMLVNGDWRVQTVIEMMGQSAVMGAEQNLLNKNGNSAEINKVIEDYKGIYNSALVGVCKSKIYLEKIINLIDGINEMSDVSPVSLRGRNLHRWMPDGKENTLAI